MNKTLMMVALMTAGALAGPVLAQTPVAGSTTVGITITEATQLAMGWSVKKSLLGQSVYNDAGDKVGKVEDLIISPDKSVSYVIIGAGGFIGIGRHDVAIPVAQIQDNGGKLMMPEATKDMVKAMPQFEYASDTSRRDAFVTRTDKDVAAARARLADLKQRAGTASAEAKARIELQATAVEMDLKSLEAKLADLKRASASRWHESERDVNAANARLKKSLAAAVA